MRAVTHYDVSREQCVEASEALAEVLSAARDTKDIRAR
jgi:hypothetical protein